MYPETRIWRLGTPTQVLRNSVFYINNIEVIKLVANHQMNKAQTILEEYIKIAANEIENAKEAETLSRKFFEKDTKDTTTWKRAEAA